MYEWFPPDYSQLLLLQGSANLKAILFGYTVSVMVLLPSTGHAALLDRSWLQG